MVLISVLICLGVVEAVLRVFAPQINEHDKMFMFNPELGWSFIPEKKGMIIYPGEANHEIVINEAGFRDAPFVDLPDQKKVMVFGDSFVSNVSVKAPEVFTEVLEQQLNAISVMNFGVNGYGQVQELLLLRNWVDRVDPELVVLTVYVRNDFADNMGKGQWNYDKPVATWEDSLKILSMEEVVSDRGRLGNKRPAGQKFYHHLHLYHFVKQRLFNMQSKYRTESRAKVSAYVPPELYLCLKETTPEVMTMRRVMEQLLLEFSNELASRNIPFVLMIAPSIVQVEEALWQQLISTQTDDPGEYDRTLPNRQLESFAQANGILTLNLFPRLRELSTQGRTLYNANEQHWNREGNQVVANELQAFLELHVSDIFQPE